MFANVEFTEIRGNVDTRLKKIAELHVADATILAAAGLKRLGIGSWPGVEFRPIGHERMVPAVGQGAIAVQCRSEDEHQFAGTFDAATARGLAVERAIQSALGAGCHTALGVYATADSLYLFHEDVGLKTIGLTQRDFDSPGAAATRILGLIGLR
jgi:hydroxymethylbilane synthase